MTAGVAVETFDAVKARFELSEVLRKSRSVMRAIGWVAVAPKELAFRRLNLGNHRNEQAGTTLKLSSIGSPLGGLSLLVATGQREARAEFGGKLE